MIGTIFQHLFDVVNEHAFVWHPKQDDPVRCLMQRCKRWMTSLACQSSFDEALLDLLALPNGRRTGTYVGDDDSAEAMRDENQRPVPGLVFRGSAVVYCLWHSPM